MAMRHRCARVLAVDAAAVLAATLGVPAALAAGTWTIQPGGGIRATSSSGQFTLTDTATRAVISCAHSTASGTLKSGTGLPGSQAGSLPAVSFSRCEFRPMPFPLQAGGLPWHVNFSSYNAANGVARGTLSHLRITGSASGCAFAVDGTSGTAGDGRVVFRYTDSTGRLKLLAAGGDLHFYEVSKGCLGSVNSGDPATLDATYTVTPRQAITSP
jgi:hypothetical protein